MWITAWHGISRREAVYCFKKFCICNTVEGTDDDMQWNDSEVGDVRSECEEDDGIYCKDGVSDTD
jgi:hypothetical protein